MNCKQNAGRSLWCFIGVLLGMATAGIAGKWMYGEKAELNTSGATANTKVRRDIEVKYKAINGDRDAARQMFNQYLFAHQDYQKAYYWAVICERQGFATQLENFVESTESSIRADIMELRKGENESKNSGAEKKVTYDQIPPP